MFHCSLILEEMSPYFSYSWYQCFDDVGWKTGRASSL